MTRIRVGVGVVNQTPFDWDGNLRNLLEAVRVARSLEVRVLCLPELCITGYGCEDQFHAPGLYRTALEMLDELIPATKGMIVGVGLPVAYQGSLFDAACLLVDGEIAGVVAKQFLAGEGLHYEPRWFKPWPAGVIGSIELGGRSVAMGDLLFDCGGVKVGFEICEDAWVAQRPGIDLARRGVDIILNPSASHFAFGKFDVRKRFVTEGSRAFDTTYVHANLLGNESGRIIYDGGALIASAGELVALGRRFSFHPVDVTVATVDVAQTRVLRTRASDAGVDADADDPNATITRPFDFPDIEPSTVTSEPEAWELGANRKEEEFTRAIALGLFDYMRKSRSRGFIVSLSGGADSSAVACLVALMVRLATTDLGRDRFLSSLGYMPELAEVGDDQLVARLLTCVYQATRNSSVTTRHAAETVAGAIGGEMACIEIDELVDRYVGQAESVLGRELTWERDDVALQNIQARVRAPSVWLLANVRGALLLATSNRSEAAVGYATMDGDTCGGLSPIAGIDKAFLRRWLEWLRAEGPAELGAIAELEVVTRLAPTAELRPLSNHQTDEDDLMPYDVLDVIERAAIRDKRGPIEVYRLLRARFAETSSAELVTWIERFFRLWCRNQWKRERYAPSFHVDDENLDPKSWCRFPILSGGFARELEELRQYADEA